MVELPKHSAIYKLQVQQGKTALRQLCSFLSSKHTPQSIARFISVKSCRENPPQLWSHTWAASWVLFCTGVRLKLEQDRVPRLARLRAGRRISTGCAVCWCWSEFLLLIQGGALTFHQVWLKACTSNKPHQQVYLNYLGFFSFMRPCDVLTKALHIFFRAAGGKWWMQHFHSVKHPTLIDTPGQRPQWEIHNLPIRLQCTPAWLLTQS